MERYLMTQMSFGSSVRAFPYVLKLLYKTANKLQLQHQRNAKNEHLFLLSSTNSFLMNSII